jgi:SET domain-containing protein
MALLEKQLVIKKSTLAGAGKGLFTRKFIPKGARIVEYKGNRVTWKEVEKMPDYRNGYAFYITSQCVIDAFNYKKAKGRYANDAKGISRTKGINTNSEYVTEARRCYIEAIRDIAPGSEIFVEYGAEYWQVIRYNLRVEKQNKETERRGKKLPAKRSTRR